jgi:hypothetical protein
MGDPFLPSNGIISTISTSNSITDGINEFLGGWEIALSPCSCWCARLDLNQEPSDPKACKVPDSFGKTQVFRSFLHLRRAAADSGNAS